MENSPLIPPGNPDLREVRMDSHIRKTGKALGRPKGARDKRARKRVRRFEQDGRKKNRARHLGKIDRRPKTEEAYQRQIAGLEKGRETRRRNRLLREAGIVPENVAAPKSQSAQWKAIWDASAIEIAMSPNFLNLKLFPSTEVLIRAQYGLPMPDDLLPLYRELSHLTQIPNPEQTPFQNETVFEPDREKSEATWIVGRRGTKSTTAAICAIVEATRMHWHQYMLVGEIGYFIHLATRQTQCNQVVGGMIKRMLLQAGPGFEGIVAGSTKDTIDLTNNITIQSFPTNSTSYLGLPCIGAILDEVPKFYKEGPKADEEILLNLKPGMAQFHGRAKLFLIGSPVAKQGVAWDSYKEGAQVSGRLTVQADSATMNPTLTAAFLKKEEKRDPDGFKREYEAQFAERVEQLFTDRMLDGAMMFAGDQPYNSDFDYSGGLDASGLSGRDRMGFAIAGRNRREKVTVPIVRSYDIDIVNTNSNGEDTLNVCDEVDEAFDEIAALCRIYGIATIWVDGYSFAYVKMLMARRGIAVEKRPTLATIYSNLRTIMLANRVSLPMDAELRDGLEKTEIYYSRGNQPTIGREQSSQGHGDKADGVASAVWGASQVEEDTPEEVVVLDVLPEFEADLLIDPYADELMAVGGWE